MKYNELTISSNKKAKRVGRGIAAGQGKTAGRGTKGQGARKSSIKKGFSGGQTPLYMQIPKLRGFKSKRPVVENIYTGQLDSIKKTAIDTQTLAEHKLISSPFVEVKLIANGEVKTKKTVQVQGASAGARALVEKAGGQVEIIAQVPSPTKPTSSAKA